MATTSGGFVLEHAELTVPPVHIPDGRGGAYKTELVIERAQAGTTKILWWHADDPRSDPHNHPWSDEAGVAFRSEILHGGYTEDRWALTATIVPVDGVKYLGHNVYRAGDTNTMPQDVFHVVHQVLPGTVTRMTCGPAVLGNEWHYLDIDTGQLRLPTNPQFRADVEAINPHLRQATEV